MASGEIHAATGPGLVAPHLAFCFIAAVSASIQVVIGSVGPPVAPATRPSGSPLKTSLYAMQ